ncbi:MAG: bifunctional diaminohydroxyphosphoribosylaminopyrimidine deaminase/5-amino-6-(5-phosphoribosylamino)uracil reductase RibD [Hydrogenophilaceae bacterium]|nr:bifunctional diaminohydroxyphosphoribosylaminopyrimidine deaminase/5-amino-6-(5-phosphoribosylamino)uracil reductase RibD [Hydrogenophilaceae bacterium]
MPFTADDHAHMARALRLAERGLYSTTPNPRVGCVIVKNGQIIGEGWHQKAGEPHAEINALMQAGPASLGSTVYVTLEPCSHHGRTPPCADALIGAGVAKVIAAMQDPNPHVSGSGLARLKAAGITVEHGLLAQQAHDLNAGFVKRMVLGHPYVRIKTASSLDGKTALSSGESKWITGEAARADVHRLRARSCAILAGIGTVLADNPQLNVRGLETSRQPVKVIVDSTLRTPPDARVLQGAKTLVACTEPDTKKAAALEAAGAEILCLPGADGRVNLHALLSRLAHKGVNEVMTEAGSRLNGALLAAGLVDEWVQYVAPCLLGSAARPLFDIPQPATMPERLTWKLADQRMFGSDLRFVWRKA